MAYRKTNIRQRITSIILAAAMLGTSPGHAFAESEDSFAVPESTESGMLSASSDSMTEAYLPTFEDVSDASGSDASDIQEASALPAEEAASPQNTTSEPAGSTDYSGSGEAGQTVSVSDTGAQADPVLPADDSGAAALPGMEEDTVQDEADPIEYEDEEVLVEKTLELQMTPLRLYEHDDVPTSELDTANQLWQWLYGRDPKPDPNPSPAAINVKIKGNLPEDVTAQAGYILFDDKKDEEGNDYPETAIASVDVSFVRSDGSEYIPVSDLKVTVSGQAVEEVISGADPYFLVYAHDEYNAMEALIVDESTFTSDVTVFRELPENDLDAQNEYWSKHADRLAYVTNQTHEPVTFIEDAEGLKLKKKKKKITFTFNEGTPLRFIVSAQTPEADIAVEDIPVEIEGDETEGLPVVEMPETESIPVPETEAAAVQETEAVIIEETEAATVPETEIQTEFVEETEAEQIEIPVASETESEIKAEAEPEEETEIQTVVETETESAEETESEIQAVVESEMETTTETEEPLETETEEDVLVSRSLKVRSDDGSTLVSVSGMLPKDVTADATSEDAEAYSSDLDGEGLLALDITLSRGEGYVSDTDASAEMSGDDAAAEAADRTDSYQTDASQDDISDADVSEDVNGFAESVSYQPEEPVRVVLTDPAIGEAVKNDSELEVWHIADDGTSTKVENVRFVGNSAVFYADGFSVYVVTQVVKEQTLTASDGNTYEIKVEYDSTSGIPADAELEVTELLEGTPEYDAYVAKTAETLGKVLEDLSFAKAFDIKLTDPETGERYQPDKDVKVSVRLMDQDVEKEEEISVVHFEKKGEEGSESDGFSVYDGQTDGFSVYEIPCEVANGTVEFETDGFSVYVLTGYTVDFHWGEYTYSIAGESEIALSALLEKLGVTEIALADIEEVTFSNPDLVGVEKLDADWLLKSLAPFNTEEALVLALRNGESVEIRVTDAVTLPVGPTEWKNGTNGSGTWAVDENGVLTITGTGKMKDFSSGNYVKDTPWFAYINDTASNGVDSVVTKIVISDGITRIGTNTFTRTYNLNEIDASNCATLQTIGGSAFKQQSGSTPNNMQNPKTVNFSGCTNLTKIEGQAFQDCKGITTLNFSNTNLSTIDSNAFLNCIGITYLDISGTKLSQTQLSNTTAGFGASMASIQTLNANNCPNITGQLTLSKYTALTTLGLSGCTDLTGLTIPSSVTSLDVSGCTGLTSLTVPGGVTSLNVSGSGLTSLDVSACTGLTTLDVSGCTGLTSLTVPSGVTSLNVSDSGLTSLDVSACTGLTTLDVSGTGLTSLTVPSGVTSLNVSGCTGLTSLTVPNSVESLNASGCTGITALDLSETSLTNIDVSDNASLTALKLPEMVTALKVTDCPYLVIYFDGKAEDLPGMPDNVKLISWGDYTYAIKKNNTATLEDIFTALGITAISVSDVQSIATDSGVLAVTDLTVTCLDAFTDTQALTVTLKNGMTGNISVECQMVAEKDNLNLFLDSGTVYSYEGETDTHPLSESAILKAGDVLNLNLTLSFSEIPEGEEGERQMKLLSPMKYTFPEGLTVSDVPDTVTFSVQSGEQTLSFTVSASFDEETRELTIIGNYGDQVAVVSASDTVSFTVPVSVQVNTVPGVYVLADSLTLSAVKSHNVKVSSFTAGDYNAEKGTVTYTAVVEAENDLDFDGNEYFVEIADSATGAVGSYTYAHKEGFVPTEGAPATQVNGQEVQPGVETSFTGFPLTVAHMYEGDTVTLTYTAKPLHGSYDKDTQVVTAENTITITNKDTDGKPNPANDPTDDTASFTTEGVPYTPLTREYITLDGSWAYWKVTVNPSAYTIGGGESLTLVDNFDDHNTLDGRQSIDYASIRVTSNDVSYDYSGETGTFVIPDNTPVIITYRTRIKAQPGEAKTFRGTAELFNHDEKKIASSTAGVIEKAAPIYPSPSDVGGFGDNFMVKLYVYGEKAMQTGIEGAAFILLDANQRALEYTVGENKGQPVTFTTGDDGYVNIELHEEEGDVSIEKNTGYYLEMIQAVPGYQKDNTLYSFMITDDPDYSSGGFYNYYNGDTMKVRLYPAAPGLRVSIRFSGSYALREDQQNAVTAVLQKWVDNGDGIDDDNDWIEVERHPYTDTKWGAITFEEKLYDADLEYQNIYRVVEENHSPWDLPEEIVLETTYYCLVNAESAEPKTEPQPFEVESADAVVSVVIDNRYEEPQLTIIKMDKSTGATLPGAEFSVYKIVNGAQTGGVVTTYTTDDAGQLVIRGGERFESETLYGIKETVPPTDYLLPLEAEWHYFYFCNDEYLEPSILANLPEGATAVNLTNNGDRVTICNQEKTITVPVMKLWQGAAWPNNDEVLIGLYQSVAGSDPVPVLNEDGTPRQVPLNKGMPYNNTAFTELPSRDSQDRNIVYSIKEESISGKDPLDAGYNQEYGISSAGVYIVRNKPATALTVSKEWYDWNDVQVTDPDILAAQSSVTFDVYRSSTKYEDTDPEDGVTNADMTAFVSTLTKVRENLSFGASNNWSMSIRDLDRQDDLGNPYYYYILETVPNFGNELYVLDEDSGSIKIQNKIAPEIVNLTVTKAPLKDDPRPESLDRDFTFTLKLMADDTHPVRSWQVYKDAETTLTTDWNGEAAFKLRPTNPAQQPTPGASITLSLPAGVTATVTEAYNPEYTVETSASIAGTTGDDGRTFSYVTDSGTDSVTLTYTNTLHVICKIITDDGAQIPFESINSALTRLRNPGAGEAFTSPWTIYMLEDYTIPVTDEVDVRAGEELTLTTATTDETDLFPFKGGKETDRAVITRGGVGGSMLKNSSVLTLENIVLDGAKNSYTAIGDGGLVNSTGTLNLNNKTTLRNSAVDGKGGAVYAEGTVNIVDGVVIGDNSAPSASALYLKGTVNMSGGSITGNTGASDGAVVAESSGDVVNLSGSPEIYGNTNAQKKAANLYIGVDSDNTINVKGITEDAHIGVTAMEGHMLIGEQFATAEYGMTDNLGRFVNDAYGYRGKLKDGTSTNIVWDGLTVKIQKSVDPIGANANDRFTISLSSTSIVMSTYVIDGTLDYTVSPARLNRPGRITLRNIKADDEITISPLPVGDYTISEEASNYDPTYTVVETGSSEEPTVIGDGKFTADNNCSVTVTNTRKLARVKLIKSLEDRLAGNTPVPFDFTVLLTEADGTPIKSFTLADGITTGENDGIATFSMSPTDAEDVVQYLRAPVGATMTITETVNPNYGITVSAVTVPAEGEGEAIADLDEDADNVFSFRVTDNEAAVTFANKRKMAEIELSKTLVGKVSKEESFTFTLTLTNGTTPVANYAVYRDETNPEKNITTDENGVATIELVFGENETEPKSIPLTIPDGTKLVVTETEVKKTISGSEQAIYTTKYSINDAAQETGLTATINKVSENDHSIAFTNTRKTNTIVVKNTVNGYSGNVVPFTYTATVTDGGENQNDYDLYGFTDGVMTFELTTGQTRTLTVPYGATLTVAETFIVGYSTTVKRGGATAVEALSDTFVVSVNMPSSSPLLFTNKQLIGLQLVNHTSSKLENVKVTVEKNKIYRVNSDRTGQELIGSNKTATLSVAAGETVVLEIEHDTSKMDASQSYTVNGTTPAIGYYYTVNNEPSFHEYADPAILRVYDAANYEVKGKLRYSVQDSIVTFTEQPLVSFETNGGEWTTAMEDYHWDNVHKVYQMAVTSGEKVDRPSPDPIYPTAEEIALLGWTTDEAFAKAGHTPGEDISAKAYDFNTTVTAPVTLFAVWAKPARSTCTVTLKNSTGNPLNLSLTLINSSRVGNITLADSVVTDRSGNADITLDNGSFINLSIPAASKFVIQGIPSDVFGVSEEFSDSDSVPESYTIASVDRDGTVSFTAGVCKITDEDGNILYKANGNPAVYATLQAAFTAYNGTLYADADHTTLATQACVKMLVDEYAITSKHTFPTKNVIITTADKDDASFPYVGTRDRATLYRDSSFTNDTLFVFGDTKTEVTLDRIILDGRNISVSVGGGLIWEEKTGAVLVTTKNTIMRNVTCTNGAIHVKTGTLKIEGGLFSNLKAVDGGAIYVEGSSTLNLSGSDRSTVFEDCTASSGDGGAIYYKAPQNLGITGFQTDSDGKRLSNNPGIVFNRCVAASSNGDGGAIYVTTSYNYTVSVSDCEFTECSSKVTSGGDTTGNGGGGISAYQVKGLNVARCSFTDCDTMRGGGAVTSYVSTYVPTTDQPFTVTDGPITKRVAIAIEDCSFERCNCRGQGGAVAVYQKETGNKNSSTLLFVKGSEFNNCSSGTQNGSGGAIQCYLPCFEFVNSQFNNCWAGKEGGAVNNYFGGNYNELWTNSSMTVSGCTFTKCRAEDRFEVNSVIHYGGAINTKVKTVSVNDSTFTECVSTLRDGGALHLGGCGKGTTASVTGSTFTSCTAKRHGGAVFSSAETLTISDSTTFSNCASTGDLGGAVYHGMNCREESNVKASTSITSCTFDSCSAAANGGAVWSAAKAANITGCTITDCTAESGGAIYLSKDDIKNTINGSRVETGLTPIEVTKPTDALARGTITGGSITDCEAVSGSAVYVGDSATFSGDLEVSGNAVSGANSGAIQTVDAGKLYFEGNVKVEGNTSSAEADDHDVLMQIDGNTIINTTSVGLGSGAKIGVYVSDPNDAYANHGKYSQPFGTYHDSDAGCNFLDAFFNNRDGELYGYQGTDDLYIHWGFYVCKITDADGNTLKRTNGRDAVYLQLQTAVDEFAAVTGGTPVYIKMLVENYAIRQEEAVSNFPDANITLTTETYTGTESVEGKYDGKHPYRGTEGTFSTIYRTNSVNPLFNLSTENAEFQLKDITLDGRNDKTATEGAYKLITSDKGAIVVNSGTTLQYAKGDSGAAITGVQVTINGSYDGGKKEPTVKITNCTVTGSGGAISTQNLTITNTSTKAGEYGTVFTNCTSGTETEPGSGGVIYATGTAVSMAGASFTDCQSTGEGGVLFHNYTGTESATTAITNCAFNDSEATGGAGGAVSSKAGTLTVEGSSFDTVKASGNGGAISHTGSTAATITGTTFKACRTTGSGLGGSVYTGAKVVTLNGGSFENSTAANHGGALYCASSADGSAATVSGTSFKNCSTTLETNGTGGAIYSKTMALTLQDYTPEGSTAKTAATINVCTAPGFSGAVHMETSGSILNIKDGTVISACYADKGGAIYLPAGVTMNITDSPEFSQNGYTTVNGRTVDASEGACIYLSENGRINLSGSPKFSRNILPTEPRITNGGILDNVRQDIYMAGYEGMSAGSIYVVGELAGDTIWVWPKMSPHRLPNDQFAKIAEGVTVKPETLSCFRNALADSDTHCSNGEYLAGVQLEDSNKNVYWDKMYAIEFKKKDNKGVAVPDAEFTLYKELACTTEVTKAVSADGETDTDAQGKLLARGTVEFTSIRIGAYYMKETKSPLSFKENNATYLVLVGTPYLSPNDDNRYLWEGDGPLNVADAATLVARYTTDAGKFYGIFPLDEHHKAVLRANLSSNSVGIENIRNDYQVAFMKVDSEEKALPGAAFTIYTQMLNSGGEPDTFEDGYPKLMRWSRDGETYPDPVVSADGTAAFKYKDNKTTLPKGMVYFRELPLGTYYLLETGYPERNGDRRRTYYLESDRVFKLEVTEDPNNPGIAVPTLSEWIPATEEDPAGYTPLPKDEKGYYKVSNKEVVCKLTDDNDNLLYVEGHKIWGDKEESSSRLFPAIYGTLEEGFEAAQTGSFVYSDGTPANVESSLKLKVLKDFTLSNKLNPVFYRSNRDITFTTAETRVSKDRYIFSTTRTSDTSRALISRAYDEVTSENANAGALITLKSGAKLTLQNIRLSGNNKNGRAIHVTDNSSLTIGTNTRIEYFKQEASGDSTDGNDVKGGAILLDDNTSFAINGGYNRTAIFANNQVVNNRESGSTGSDGGAIAVGKDCTFSITNAQFINNSATAAAEKKGNGGAVSINETKDAEEAMDLQIYNVVFSNNSASYKGGAVRTAENCDLTVSNCTFSSNSVSNSGSEGGAIAVLSKEDATSSLTITNGTVFTGNTAASGGAVKIGGYGMLTLDNVTIRNNTATVNGGAVSAAPGAEVRFTSGTISNNTASANGGAFYVESKVDADTPEVTTGTVSISGGSITANNASLGSAVYANDYAEITITNASITGNKASGANGGAINVGGPNTRLYFGGTPTVFDNTLSTDTSQQRNLVLSEDNNDIINTTEDGLLSGTIGVFVTESNSAGDEVFEEHGLPGKPFGTFGDQNERLNPQVFRSDHALALYGVRNEDNPNDDLIYWVDVICKLTDESDNILYQDINLTINGKTETRKAQAVYARITEYDDSDAVQNGFNALRDGFDAATGTLFSKNVNGYTAFSNTTQTDIKLKMLKDVLLDKTIVYEGNRRLTFTTAEIEETANIQAMRARGDYFLFNADTDRTDDNRDKSLITRAFNANSMINDDGTSLTLADIILEGNKENYNTRSNGGIVRVVSGRTLTITDGAILQNAKTSGNGGAVYANAESTVTMSGGTINGNNAENGAGIYLAQGSTLNLSGNPNFGGTDQNTDGSLKGTEGNFVSKTFNDTDFKQGAKNGGKDYPVDTENSESRLVRQDIYLAGAAAENQALTSITLTGNLASTVPAGSIWVWAAGTNNTEPNHYYMLKQFAVLDSSFSGTVSDATYSAFRNARADADTDCGGDYLTGQSGDNIGSTRCIYWTGGFDFVFKKISSDGAALDGATFTLYIADSAGTGIKTENDQDVAYQVTGEGGKKVDATAISGGTDDKKAGTDAAHAVTIKVNTGRTASPIVSDKSVYGEGLVVFEKIPPGTYFIREEIRTDEGTVTGAPKLDPTSTATDAPTYQPVEEMYKLVLDGKGYYTIYVPASYDSTTGDPVWTPAEGETLSEAPKTTITMSSDNTYDIYTVMNVSPLKRKVTLRKVADSTYTPLGENNSTATATDAQAVFTVYYADKQTVVRIPHTTTTTSEGTTQTTTTYETLKDLKSGAAGAFWIGELPYGTYYLEETAAPTSPNTYSKPSTYFVLKVDANGVTQMEGTGGSDQANELRASNRVEDAVTQPKTTKTNNSPNQTLASQRRLLSSMPRVKTETEIESSDGNMWGSVTGDVEMETSEETWSFTDSNGATVEGKSAYVWPDDENGDLASTQDTFSASAGTLIQYKDAFRLLTEDFSADVSQLNAIEEHSIALSDSPTILTDADFTADDSTTDPEKVSVSEETVLYTDGTDYWILIKDGSPKNPKEDSGSWLKITKVLKGS